MAALNRAVIALAVLAFAGLLVFGIMARSSVSLESMPAAQARDELEAVLVSVGQRPPLLQENELGDLVRESRAAAVDPPSLERLRVVSFRATEERLVRAGVPFWFARMKDPAVRLFLRGTGVDLERLGLSAADLQREGPGLILDQTAANGDRWIVWTE